MSAGGQLDKAIWDAVHEDAVRNKGQLKTSAAMIRFAESSYHRRLDAAVADGIRSITKSPGPHEDIVWKAAAQWTQEGHFEHWLYSSDMINIVCYLKCFGYPAIDGKQWQEASGSRSWPQISLSIKETSDNGGHEEHAGYTWYMVECSVGPISSDARQQHGPYTLSIDGQTESVESVDAGEHHLSWRAPRRLAHMREALHDYIKVQLGDAYAGHFGETPFAKHGAPAGTTARLRAWLAKLTQIINQRGASPEIVTRTIMFFRPPTETGKTGQAQAPTQAAGLREAGQQQVAAPTSPLQDSTAGPSGASAPQDDAEVGVTVESCAHGEDPLKQGAL